MNSTALSEVCSPLSSSFSLVQRSHQGVSPPNVPRSLYCWTYLTWYTRLWFTWYGVPDGVFIPAQALYVGDQSQIKTKNSTIRSKSDCPPLIFSSPNLLCPHIVVSPLSRCWSLPYFIGKWPMRWAQMGSNYMSCSSGVKIAYWYHLYSMKQFDHYT